MANFSSTIERSVNRQTENLDTDSPEWVHNAQMEEYRKILYSGVEIDQSDVVSERVATKTSASEDVLPAPAPSAADRMASYHAHPAPQRNYNLFEGYTLKTNGELVIDRPMQEMETAEAPVAQAAAPSVRSDDENDDARPTPRTMASLIKAEATVRQGFFASLSTQTKVVLAVLAAVIVLALVLICINTAVLGSLDAQIVDRQVLSQQLSQQVREVLSEIDDVTSFQHVQNWWSIANGIS